jgi:hypothetical protein
MPTQLIENYSQAWVGSRKEVPLTFRLEAKSRHESSVEQEQRPKPNRREGQEEQRTSW